MSRAEILEELRQDMVHRYHRASTEAVRAAIESVKLVTSIHRMLKKAGLVTKSQPNYKEIRNAIKSVQARTPQSDKPVTIFYENWRGEQRYRKIIPHEIWFGTTEWHPDPEWLLTALDVDRNAIRHFSMKGIREWCGEA